MAAHSHNPFWFKRKKVEEKCARPSSLTIGPALKAAYKAGQESGSTLAFRNWLCKKGLQNRGELLVSKLRAEYKKGVEGGEPSSKKTEAPKGWKLDSAGHAIPGSYIPSKEWQSLHSAKEGGDRVEGKHGGVITAHEYKGVKIRQTPDGEFFMDFDRDSLFETVKEAKEHIDWWKGTRENPPRRRILDEIMAEHISMPGFPQMIVTRDFVHHYLKNLGWDQHAQGIGSAHFLTMHGRPVDAPLTDEATRDYNLNQESVREGFRRNNPGEDSLYDRVIARLSEPDGVVAVVTHLKQWHYFPKHKALFVRPKKESETGVYVKRGRQLDYVFPEYVHLGRVVGKKKNPVFDVRMNPEPEAASLYETFHGRAPEEIITVRESLHTHGYLTTLGVLLQLSVNTESGYEADLAFPNPDEDSHPENYVYLASSEDGKQYYFVSGDQELDLKALHMNGDEWERDSMTIGKVTVIDYVAEKTFDQGPSIQQPYTHKVGAEIVNGRHRITTKTQPTLVYDNINHLLSLHGGLYFTDQWIKR